MTVLAQNRKSKYYNVDELKWAIRHWAAKMSVKTSEIHIREMTTKWASISSKGRLTLSTDMLKLPKELGEYIIVHELVHLLVPNHGNVFKRFMLAYLPDWEDRKKQLNSFKKD